MLYNSVLQISDETVPSFSGLVLVAYRVQDPQVGALWLTELDQAVQF